MRAALLTLLVLAAVSFPVAGQQAPGIGYPTVAAALEALKARSDVSISIQSGWTIVNERSVNTLWSFTPPGHPAHPAVVKRAVVSRGGAVAIDMTALCQAGKGACDKLIAEFQELNEKIAQSLRSKAQAAQDAPASEIQVDRIGEDSFRLVLRSYRSSTVEAGQQELLSRAIEACGGRSVGYGRYEFEIAEPVGPATAEKRPLILRQDVRCGDRAGSPPPAAVAASPGQQSRATAAQEQLVERQTYAYFSAKDTRKYQEAYALFSASQKQTVSFDHWAAAGEKFNSQAGEVRSRKIKKLTWYRDPPGVAPGLYAAVDFASEFANIDIHCGYVVWHEQSDGSFLLVREEENYVDKATQQKLKPEDLNKVRAQFRC